MTTQSAAGSGTRPPFDHTTVTHDLVGAPEHFPEPTAAMVLHRVLAMAARTFLLNDMGDELMDEDRREGTLDALTVKMGTRPLWAQSALESLEGTERRTTETERIHQSRVAMRRTRSNLRTFRLLFDPAWSTALRAELAWYGDRLGVSRDLTILRGMIREKGPHVLDQDQVDQLVAVVTERLARTMDDIASERGKARRFQLTEQMMGLWDGPHFKAKASKPAEDILPDLLTRAWLDLRGASSKARKKPTNANLHKLRIRLKDLRYGCETVALVEGSPARKTARAAEKLQGKLGDLHDAVFAIDWLEALAIDRPDLADPIDELISVEEDAAAECRKGWKKELKEVERRWRRWRS